MSKTMSVAEFKAKCPSREAALLGVGPEAAGAYSRRARAMSDNASSLRYLNTRACCDCLVP